MRLSMKATALTGSILCGFGLFLLTWWIILFDGASSDPTFIGRVYRGYTVTPLGSVIGLAWGFVDGLIGGVIIAWLYNTLAGRQSAQK
jgi:hypothetical protein